MAILVKDALSLDMMKETKLLAGGEQVRTIIAPGEFSKILLLVVVTYASKIAQLGPVVS